MNHDKDKKEEKAAKKEQDDADLSEQEEAADEKKKAKESDAAKDEGPLGKMKEMLNKINDPNGGGPDGNLIKVLVALIGGIVLFKLYELFYGKKMPTEITYQSFLQMM